MTLNKANDELENELLHTRLLSILAPIFKRNGIAVEELDSAIAEIEITLSARINHRLTQFAEELTGTAIEYPIMDNDEIIGVDLAIPTQNVDATLKEFVKGEKLE